MNEIPFKRHFIDDSETLIFFTVAVIQVLSFFFIILENSLGETSKDTCLGSFMKSLIFRCLQFMTVSEDNLSMRALKELLKVYFRSHSSSNKGFVESSKAVIIA